MSDVPAKDLEATVGKPAFGPDGFGVHHVVAKAAHISADQQTVHMEVDEKSLAAAIARNNGGENKEFSKAREQRLKQGKLNNQNGATFAKLKKHGLNGKVEQVMARAPAKMVSDPSKDSKGAKPRDPHSGVKRDHFERVAKQLEAVPKTSVKRINPKMLPEPVQEKLVMEALENGKANTALGRMDTPDDLPAVIKTNAKVQQSFKVAQASKSLDAAYKKYGDMIEPGSILGEMTPRRR